MISCQKIKLLNQTIFLFVLPILFQGYEAHNKNNETDIEFTQKSAALIPEKKLFSGNFDIKYSFKSQTLKYEVEDYFYDIPDPIKDFFEVDSSFRKFRFQLPQYLKYNSETTIGKGFRMILTFVGYNKSNNHMIKNTEEIAITLLDGLSYLAEVIGNDSKTNLALLAIKKSNLSCIRFGDSDIIEMGEWTVAT